MKEVVVDIELALNKRPLSYLEDDVELPALAPSSILHVGPMHLPAELQAYHLPEKGPEQKSKIPSQVQRSYVETLALGV